jgi:hypothetical protein
MDTLPSKPERNPITEKAFNKQVGFQIYLPLGIFLLLLGVLVYLLWTFEAGGVSLWADIALIFLLLPLFLLGLLILGFFAVTVYGLSVAIGWLPYPARQGQDLLVRVKMAVDQGADALAKPILIPSAVVSAIKRGVGYLLGIFRSPEG